MEVTVYILEFGNKGSQEFLLNLQRIHTTPVTLKYISEPDAFPVIPFDHVIIDALFGIGLNRIVEGLSASLIQYINGLGCPIISIDIPSGLYADKHTPGNIIIKANTTLSFQSFKYAYLFESSYLFTGKLIILDIGLESEFLKKIHPEFKVIDLYYIRSFFKRRAPFSHKGNFGHACIVAGSNGMLGASIMASRACLRAGTGKLTILTDQESRGIFTSTLPEAMLQFVDEDGSNLEFQKFDSIAIGPGLGQSAKALSLLESVLHCTNKKIVLDADALNILASHSNLFLTAENEFVLTPHPKESDRLFGKSSDPFNRLEKARAYSKKTGAIILLKGRHSMVISPLGDIYVNFTGNPGLAKGGSGDVLTGIISGLSNQGYSLFQAVCLAVYLHGRSADLSKSAHSEESLLPTDLLNYIGKAFQELY